MAKMNFVEHSGAAGMRISSFNSPINRQWASFCSDVYSAKKNKDLGALNMCFKKPEHSEKETEFKNDKGEWKKSTNKKGNAIVQICKQRV